MAAIAEGVDPSLAGALRAQQRPAGATASVVASRWDECAVENGNRIQPLRCLELLRAPNAISEGSPVPTGR